MMVVPSLPLRVLFSTSSWGPSMLSSRLTILSWSRVERTHCTTKEQRLAYNYQDSTAAQALSGSGNVGLATSAELY